VTQLSSSAARETGSDPVEAQAAALGGVGSLIVASSRGLAPATPQLGRSLSALAACGAPVQRDRGAAACTPVGQDEGMTAPLSEGEDGGTQHAVKQEDEHPAALEGREASEMLIAYSAGVNSGESAATSGYGGSIGISRPAYDSDVARARPRAGAGFVSNEGDGDVRDDGGDSDQGGDEGMADGDEDDVDSDEDVSASDEDVAEDNEGVVESDSDEGEDGEDGGEDNDDTYGHGHGGHGGDEGSGDEGDAAEEGDYGGGDGGSDGGGGEEHDDEACTMGGQPGDALDKALPSSDREDAASMDFEQR